MPRQARLDSPGTLHHVIIRGINKRRIVDDEQDRSDFVRRLGSLAVETETAIYAWALMSNHAHVLVCSGRLGLAKFMRRLLTGYAVSYNLRHRRDGHLFQNRYKSMVCDGELFHGAGALYPSQYVTGRVGKGRKRTGAVARQVGISTSGVAKILTRSLSE